MFQSIFISWKSKTLFQVGILLLFIIFLNFRSAYAQPATSTVVINEFMSSNADTIADEDGSFEDWIELYNQGSSPVSLLGVGLSDTVAEPFRWTFPDVTLAPGQFMLVWASGKNRINPNGPLHTNFSISAGGETLTLSDPSGSVIDQAAPIRLAQGIAYGRSPDGGATWYYFDQPTPGSSNIHPGYTEILSPPLFSQNGGFYTEAFDLNITSQEAGTTVYFTLDGSAPDALNLNGHTYSYKQNYAQFPNSPFGDLLTGSFQTFVYSQTLHIKDRSLEPDRITGRASTWQESPASYTPLNPVFKGTIVRARAVKAGAMPSPIVSQTYFVTPEGAQRYTLPVLSLGIQEDYLYDYNDGIYVPGAIFDQWRVENPDATANASVVGNYSQSTEYPVSFELFTQDGGRVLAQNLGFRIHGGQSRAVPQKSLRLYANSQYDSSDVLDYPFFADLTDKITGQPITTFHRLLLRNSGDDTAKTRMRDAFVQTLMKPLGLDGLAYQPAVEFINGEYWGLINIRERLDRYYLASHYQVDPGDVALLENNAELQEGDATDVADYVALRTYIQEHDMADPVNYAYAEARMDMDNFILYNVAEIFTGNSDWPHNNIQFWRKRIPDTSPSAPPEHDGRWRWLLYDFDFSFGLFPGTDFNTLEWAIRESPDRDWSTVMLRKLLANPEFRERFINAASDHLNTTFQPEHIVALANQLHDRIAPYLDEHAVRWRNTLDTSIAPIIDFGTDRAGYVREDWEVHFGLPAPVTMNFNVSNPNQGYLQVNTVKIDSNTPGLPNPALPYPWQGVYYPNVPIQVTAHAYPGYHFIGWLEYPDEQGTTITVTPANGASLTALFESQTLLHYWDFNDTTQLLSAKYSFADATLTTQLSADAAVLDGTGQGFADANAQLGSETGTHLRVNNPLGASLFFALPTTGMNDIVIRYETRRSGQGAGTQKIAYTTDGNSYKSFTTLQIYDADPVVYTLNFSALDAVSNNPHFGIRITFEQGAGGVAGNNRFDNFSMTGSLFKYALEVQRAGTGSGTVTSTGNEINCGSKCVATFDLGTTHAITLSATPQPNSLFTGWSGACSGNGSCTLSLAESMLVTAAFQLKSYSVGLVANPAQGGTVSGGGTFNHGESVTVEATANPGYRFSAWSENGTTVSTDGNYSFTAIANRDLVANFSLNPYTINLNADPAEGGTASGGGNFNPGATVTVQATANDGYSFTGWSENGTPVSTDTSYSFTATANRDLVANFSLNPYTINVNANPAEGGTVSGGGNFNLGATVTVQATVNDGYSFTGWSENGTIVSANASYSFAATANRDLVANFSLNPYTINVNANPAEGGTVSGGGEFSAGDTVTVQATANEGYTFTGWSENGTTVSADASYSFAATANRNLVANFSLSQYSIFVSANPAEGGTVSGVGTYSHGASVTIVATANSGYGFAGWSENGSLASTNASYSFVATRDRNLVANFANTPLAVNDVAGTSATSAVQIAVLDNDLDPAGGGLRIVEVTPPTHGTVITSGIVSASQEQLLYTPESNFSGVDFFSYTVEDVHGLRASATVSVIVTNPADGKAAPEVRVVDNGKENILSFTGLTLTLPAGSYSGTLTSTDLFYIVFTEITTPGEHVTLPPGGNIQFAGRTFILEAYLNNTLLTDYAFPASLTVMVSYDPADLSGLDEKTIALYYWDPAEAKWSEAELTRLAVDSDAHTVTYRVAHFTEYALFAEKASEPATERKYWFPLILN